MEWTTLTSSILSEIVTGLLWCFSDWCTCSHGIHTETWPTPSTETLSIPSCQTGTSRTWAVTIHLTTDVLSSRCMQYIRTMNHVHTVAEQCMTCHGLCFLWTLCIQFMALERRVSPNINKHIDLMCTFTFLYKYIGILSFMLITSKYPWAF